MNSGYYTQPLYPSSTMQPGSPMPSGTPNQQMVPPMDQVMQAGEQQSFIENILRINKGKIVKVYMSFPDSVDWRDKVFTGVIEAAGRDHLVISDPNTGFRYLLPLIYLDFAEFDEPIKYSPTFETPPR
jgi:spore germination protein Q